MKRKATKESADMAKCLGLSLGYAFCAYFIYSLCFNFYFIYLLCFN